MRRAPRDIDGFDERADLKEDSEGDRVSPTTDAFDDEGDDIWPPREGTEPPFEINDEDLPLNDAEVAVLITSPSETPALDPELDAPDGDDDDHGTPTPPDSEDDDNDELPDPSTPEDSKEDDDDDDNDGTPPPPPPSEEQGGSSDIWPPKEGTDAPLEVGDEDLPLDEDEIAVLIPPAPVPSSSTSGDGWDGIPTHMPTPTPTSSESTTQTTSSRTRTRTLPAAYATDEPMIYLYSTTRDDFKGTLEELCPEDTDDPEANAKAWDLSNATILMDKLALRYGIPDDPEEEALEEGSIHAYWIFLAVAMKSELDADLRRESLADTVEETSDSSLLEKFDLYDTISGEYFQTHTKHWSEEATSSKSGLETVLGGLLDIFTMGFDMVDMVLGTGLLRRDLAFPSDLTLAAGPEHIPTTWAAGSDLEPVPNSTPGSDLARRGEPDDPPPPYSPSDSHGSRDSPVTSGSSDVSRDSDSGRRGRFNPVAIGLAIISSIFVNEKLDGYSDGDDLDSGRLPGIEESPADYIKTLHAKEFGTLRRRIDASFEVSIGLKGNMEDLRAPPKSQENRAGTALGRFWNHCGPCIGVDNPTYKAYKEYLKRGRQLRAVTSIAAHYGYRSVNLYEVTDPDSCEKIRDTGDVAYETAAWLGTDRVKKSGCYIFAHGSRYWDGAMGDDAVSVLNDGDQWILQMSVDWLEKLQDLGLPTLSDGRVDWATFHETGVNCERGNSPLKTMSIGLGSSIDDFANLLDAKLPYCSIALPVISAHWWEGKRWSGTSDRYTEPVRAKDW
ncbi:hypothetical protein ACRE_056910 [Hapsidospora chrysogenum ATCC 11550]|uniref:Uncharacterized protein n=1 Tax=Hapsidospora chrysogenum (strain ATCC 11550 / CBS 779.69 / DSM 880 / IAM 14645 / JCM 23072 / IMI 49137) TaxID=857340 RepID=A0A086T2I4_HAPC1|nr:hypothetical protein ACRE_056910 [Hapsidospora chrysogenum ATCC 11550]